MNDRKEGSAMHKYLFPAETIEELLSPGYGPTETGYAPAPGGGMFISTLTRFPYAKGKMVNWWFATFMTNIERNKIWSPDHMTFESDFKNEAGVSVAGATWKIGEYLSQGEMSRVALSFYDAAEVMDTSRFPETNVTWAICADVATQDGEPKGAFIHLVRDTYFGCEMRNRFWIADCSEEEAKETVRHNWQEMGSLAEFLPGLYTRSVPEG
jgi:hypothetical protein